MYQGCLLTALSEAERLGVSTGDKNLLLESLTKIADLQYEQAARSTLRCSRARRAKVLDALKIEKEAARLLNKLPCEAPEACKFLGFKVGDVCYQFIALPFGLKPAPGIFSRLVRVLAAELRRRGITIFCYLDDWLLLGPSRTSLAYNNKEDPVSRCRALLKLMLASQNLANFPRSISKPSGSNPAVQTTYEATTTALPETLQAQNSPQGPSCSHDRCDDACNSSVVSMSISEQGKQTQNPKPTLTLTTDASKLGWGAHMGKFKASGQWQERDSAQHINVLEMKAVQLALLAFLPQVANQCILVKSDNSTVVSYINREGGTRSSTLCFLTLEILAWCQNNHITLKACHIPGKENYIADFLSRGSYLPSEWQLNLTIVERIFSQGDQPQIDLFASALNKQLPTYCTKHQDPLAFATDSLTIPWKGILGYAFPPFPIIPQVLEKVRKEEAYVLLIAPWWPRRPWFTTLTDLLVGTPKRLPPLVDLLKQPGTDTYYPNPERLCLTLWPISGNQQLKRAFRRELQTWPLDSCDPPPGTLMILDSRDTSVV
ncbi:uncharacterized protein LOC121406794 [Lytechinus variegatus]|uniref:uncharacterized protein LOC121406794 n=1 Tax=Lytechinus variegatus TaxID=7654 RepID=UPI001BB11FE9|nr:uncharacterized protein LOC121406794 [Lytechinus variegatus]